MSDAHNNKAANQSLNYTLVVRFFILIAISLIAIGLFFDSLLTRQIDDNTEQRYLQLVSGYFLEIEHKLAINSQSEWPTVIEKMAKTTGFEIKLQNQEDMINMSNTKAKDSSQIQLLFTPDGQSIFYKKLENSNQSIFIGPIVFEKIDTGKYRLLPLFFYISIFVVVWVWMRPMIKDLDILNQTAFNLSKNYSSSTDQLKNIRTMPQLATVFINMAAHLKRLINTQKELSNALSHELRTPLSRIKFALAIVEKDMPEDSRQEVQHIYADLNEMETIIGTLLDYARLDDPDRVIQLQEVSADEWLMEQVEKFVKAPQGKHIKIDNQAKEATLTIDTYLMGLALSNLINNAIRYGKSVIHVTLTKQDETVCITVEDDGEGIPEEQHQKVFKAFYRMDKSRNKHTGGYGLGLSIVKRIMELHHGDAKTCTSTLGGACFMLEWKDK